jgi:hypothetical protein
MPVVSGFRLAGGELRSEWEAAADGIGFITAHKEVTKQKEREGFWETVRKTEETEERK